MALQTRNLWVVTLGIEGDSPPNSLQPPLPDGMHLRWTFDPAKGFPWYGYYLFRRPSGKERERICISRSLSQYKPGPLGNNHIPISFGDLSSDEPLVFTEDFPPAGIVEVDLANRSYVRYEPPASEPVWWVEATIGFRKREGRGERTCADFSREQPAMVATPLVREGARFTAFDHTGARLPSGRVVQLGGNVGWDTGRHAEIQLPCPASAVEILIAHAAQPARVVAIDTAGNIVDRAEMSGNGPEALTLTGANLAAIHVEAPQDETIVLRLCWRCSQPDGENGHDDDGSVTIPVEARWGGIVVAADSVTGTPGDVKQVQLAADAIDRVDVGSGEAVLIDLCVLFVRQGLADRWEPLEGFDYPLCLPVAHGDYPCPGAPANPAAAEATALNRITYGPVAPWAGARFNAIHSRMERLVVGGPPPGGQPMAARFEPVGGTPAPPPEAGGSITHQRQRPLDLLLLGSLQPSVAQMLGLYWWDKTAAPGVAYDYFLLADHNGSLGGSAASALAWISTVFDFTVIDGFVSYDNMVMPAVPVPPPVDARVYALPGATVAPDSGGAVIDATNNAGLTWDRKQIGNVLQSGAPVLYHVWRADLGNVETPANPGEGDFQPLTADSPLPVGRSIVTPPQTPQTPGEWPPFALHFIDRSRPDGWYAYRVSGIDIFGRHSDNSASAVWHQWSPAPDPKPWYYIDPPADRVVHISRIRLLDKLPPPLPAGVEGFALDPDDPTVLHDAAWQAWYNSLTAAEKTNVVGLRLRWQWTVAHQRQAPDTREFRVYYQSSPLNTMRGRVTSVTPASATETDVVTDIAHVQPANSFVGISARIGAQSFKIVSSAAVSPLQFRVKNIGPSDDVRPPTRTRCALPLLPGHALFEDFSSATTWQDRIQVVAYADHVQVDGSGNRTYEIFLPLPGSPNRTSLPLTTTLQEPMSAAAIGVTAADDKQHTPDHRGEAARYGNESSMGGPATVFRVRRVKPQAPPIPPDSARVFASPADYHSSSYYTYRWLPSPHLKTLVYRAMDDAVFQADLAQRPRPTLQASDAQFFPDEAVVPAWDALKRQQVANELNALNSVDPADKPAVRAAYAGLSNDGMRVLAGLPSIEKVFVQLTHQALDPDEPESGAPNGLRWRRIGPDVDPGSLAVGQRAYVDTLDGRATNRYFYRCAYVDEVHNIGPMGLSSPPVWLPDVTPPVAPRIARVAAGDRQVTLEWSSNREPDLAEYRVYRTDDASAARDIRLMDLVHTVAVAAGDPSARPRTLSWTDDPVPGLRDLWYRVVAVDRIDPDPKGCGGNVSDPSPAMRTRAYDLTPPEPPQFTTVEWVRVDVGGSVHAWADPVPAGAEWLPAVHLVWAPAAADVKLLVQVKGASDADFSAASSWLAPGTKSFLHRITRTFEAHEYRLKVVSGAGNANVIYHPATLLPPA